MLISSLSMAFIYPNVVVNEEKKSVVGRTLHPAHKAAIALDVAIAVAMIVLALINPTNLSPLHQGVLLGVGIAYIAGTLLPLGVILKLSYLFEKYFLNKPTFISVITGKVIDITPHVRPAAAAR